MKVALRSLLFAVLISLSVGASHAQPTPSKIGGNPKPPASSVLQDLMSAWGGMLAILFR